MKSNKPYLISTFFLFFLVHRAFSSAVCDERLLMMELKQDLEDNGVLDCLRVIQPPHSYIETIDERNKRIAAQWDTACAFEADYDWLKPLREIHGISNLVDDTGDIVDKDFEDQADMCEIVRAAIASGKFNKITSDLTNIPLKILDLIDCPGSPEQSEICAVTGSSYYQNDTWYILLDGMGLAVDGKPRFVIAPSEQSLPDIPEVQKSLLKNLDEAVGSNGEISDFKKQMKDNQDKLSGALDKIKGLIQNMNVNGKTEAIIVPASEKVLVYESEINSIANTVNTNKWNPFGNTIVKPVVAEDKNMLVFTISTVNFETNIPSHFVEKLLLDGAEQKDARTLQGNYIIDSLNTGFVSKLSKGDHTVHLEYRSPSPLTGQANNPENIWQDNRYICALILNGNLKFHRNNHQGPLKFAKTAVWTELKDLQSKFTVEIDRPVLFFYNIAGFGQDYVGTRLLVDGTAVKSTYKRVSPYPYIGLFGVGAKMLRQGEHTLSLEYVSGGARDLNAGTSDWQSAGLSIIELPITSVIHEKSLESAYNIAQNEWNALENLKFELNLAREKNCLIFYSATFNMKKGNWAVYTRVSHNGKELIKSRSSSSNGNIAGISAQFALNLKSGKHTLELQYYTGEKGWSIDPSDNFQAATFNIIEFEADITTNAIQ